MLRFDRRRVMVTLSRVDRQPTLRAPEPAPDAAPALRPVDLQLLELGDVRFRQDDSQENRVDAPLTGAQPWVTIACKFPDHAVEPRTLWYFTGATTTGTKWAVAEGEVGGEREVDTYLLLANTSGVTGDVKVTLLFEDGTSAQKSFDVTGNSRFNVDARAEFPAALNKRFGAIVESLGTTPAQLVVERAMYWGAAAQHWAAGTNALGTRLQ